MERVVILGGGGHAREVLQILLACRAAGHPIEPVGFVVDGAGEPDGSSVPIPHLGDLRWFEADGGEDIRVISAVGTPRLNRDVTERARALGLRFTQAIAPSAWIASSATVGEGAIVFPSAVVNADASIGAHVTLNVAATVSHDTIVGHYSGIGPGAHLAGNVVVGDGCFVGMGANVIQGVRIGEESVVGAGAVVLEDVPAGVTVVGVPARISGPASPNPLGSRPAEPSVHVGGSR